MLFKQKEMYFPQYPFANMETFKLKAVLPLDRLPPKVIECIDFLFDP